MVIKINDWLMANAQMLSWQAQMHGERFLYPDQFKIVQFEQVKVK